ncbi:DUF2530 domain-containing protein [Isoptericola jiangsuensis]|uniref:DUF2530 domain-containing protein n=1 Tax=Isoptericola jiangsuensis TaxID=548579 RepID=UPI000BF4D79C|nr:DUF2530 domain-containing protein [Isoptericola jiangsuensis]
MPSVVSLLLHPERRRTAPDPPRGDLRRAVLAGIAAWAVALVVVVVRLAAGAGTLADVLTCATGVVLGGLGLVWAHRHRDQV